LLAALAGPGLAYALGDWLLSCATEKRSDGTETLWVRLGPSTPHFTVLAPGDERATFAPIINAKDFARCAEKLAETPYEDTRALAELRGPVTVALLRSLRREKAATCWAFGPPEMIGQRDRMVKLIGRTTVGMTVHRFEVKRVEPADGM
jgi:hypothetical protein